MTLFIILIIGLIIGFIIAYYYFSKQKWGDKAQVLNERWKRNIAELEKKYEIELGKSNALAEKIREENKTQLEKLSKELQVKYIQDIEELKRLFKDSEKIIKLKSVSSSRRILVGKFIERFIPFLSKIPFIPSDMFFLGQPIDYIIFDGLHNDNIQKVVFLEIKTGEGKLTKREKGLKEVIENKQVYWYEINIDTTSDKNPDHEIQNEETVLKELYNNIDSKIKSAKSDEKLPEKVFASKPTSSQES
jgi:predicted Holliday junction resolvase-like endonuclease